jgi:hypothetical protein
MLIALCMSIANSSNERIINCDIVFVQIQETYINSIN